MRRRFGNVALSVAALLVAVLAGGRAAGAPAPASAQAPDSPKPVSFSRDLAPVLAKKCVTCHGPDKSKGHFRLDTFEGLMKAGDGKSPPVVPNEPSQSELIRRLTSPDEDERMPQKDDPLPRAQIDMVERWIREGGRFDGPDPRAPLATLIPRAPYPDPPVVYPRPVPVVALAFNPEGSELAAGGYHEVTVWNPADGSLLRRIRGIAQRTQALDYSPDGTLLAAAGGAPGQSGEVALINPTNGTVGKVVGAFPDMALAARFSPDGTRLAVGAADNSIRVFEVSSGRELLAIQQHADWVMEVAWNGDGTQLASASRDRTARVYDARTGDLETSYTGHQGPVFAVAFSQDGKRVCSAGRDHKIHLWDAKEGKAAGEIGGFEDDIFKLVVAGDWIFSCSADKRVRQHSFDKKELIRTFSGPRDWVYSVAWDGAGKRVAAGSYDGDVRVWNGADGRQVSAFVAAPGREGSGGAARASTGK